MGSTSSKAEDVFKGKDPGPFVEVEFQALEKLFGWLSEGSSGVSEQAFGRLINIPDIAPPLFLHFGHWTLYQAPPSWSTLRGPKPSHITFQCFINGVAGCSRASNASIRQIIWRLASGEDDRCDESQAEAVFRIIHATLLESSRPVGEIEEYGKCMRGEEEDLDPCETSSCGSKSLLNHFWTYASKEDGVQDGRVHFSTFNGYCSTYYPLLHASLAAYMQRRCLGALGLVRPPHLSHIHIPYLTKPSSILPASSSEVESVVLGLALSNSHLNGPWARLYTSTEDGLSFNRLVNAVQGYSGPSVLLIEDDTGAVFGGYVGCGWHETNEFFGSDVTYLFRLQPTFALYPARLSSARPNFMYLNTRGFQLPHGLGMGGTTESFRLFLPENFEQGQCRSRCMTFEPGPLAAGVAERQGYGEFAIAAVEVWGCGGEEAVKDALESQVNHRETQAAFIQKARKVDKAQFWDNEFNKEHFFSKTTGGGGHADARHGTA